MRKKRRGWNDIDRKSTRLNSSHTVIYTLSYTTLFRSKFPGCVYSEMKMCLAPSFKGCSDERYAEEAARVERYRSEEHTSELQSHSDLHSFLHDALPI